MKGICLFYKTTVLSLVIILCMAVSSAQVRLPRLVSDSMVLQRDSRTRVWGWASPGEKVMVHFNGKVYTSVTAADGNWAVMLASMPAGGPYDMSIDASNHVMVKAVLIG